MKSSKRDETMPNGIEALEPILADATPIEKLFFNELKLISKQIKDNRDCVGAKIDKIEDHFTSQSVICNKLFVKRSHIFWACLCAVCFGLGAGFWTFSEVLAIMR